MVLAILAAAGASGALAAPSPPREILPLVRNPHLVMKVTLTGGIWEVWGGRAQGQDQLFVIVPHTSPRQITGGPCPPGRTLITVCIWGQTSRDLDMTIGRVRPGVAMLEARTSAGTSVKVAKKGRFFLVSSLSSDAASVLIGRNNRGRVIVRQRIGAPPARGR